MPKTDRVTIIVLDSAGVGELPDADKFGDTGSNTLGNMSEYTNGLYLPNMEKMGLGNLTKIKGVPPSLKPTSAYGIANEKSLGKDTTVGHWEIAGFVKEKPFPSYPQGFSNEVINKITEATGRECLCNKPYSGTQLLEDYGEEHESSGKWIIYTSADPVLQIAAHEEVIPLNELYKACEKALEICQKYSPVARVIARPFTGTKGNYTRTSNRHDYAVKPDEPTMLNNLDSAGLDVISIGKINDIFSGSGITDHRGTNKNNEDGILKTIKALKEDTNGLIFTNLVDFDMLYGHRRDPYGYKKALEEFDSYIPEIISNLKQNEILIITADHGCDPTYKGSDHTREYIPILVSGNSIKPCNIGIRSSFSDIASTVEELLLDKKNPESFCNIILGENVGQ